MTSLSVGLVYNSESVSKQLSRQDPRLSGGYENVPTRDIHMNQIQYEQQWLYFLKEYIRPLQELVFTGYYHDVRFTCIWWFFQDSRLETGYEAVPTRDIHMNQVGLHDAWLKFLKDYVSPLQQHVFTGYDDYVRNLGLWKWILICTDFTMTHASFKCIGWNSRVDQWVRFLSFHLKLLTVSKNVIINTIQSYLLINSCKEGIPLRNGWWDSCFIPNTFRNYVVNYFISNHHTIISALYSKYCTL